MFQSELKAVAHDRIGVQPGQKVVIQSKTSRVFGAAVLVYVMPLLFFLAGYALAAVIGWSEGGRIALSFGALILSAVVLVLSQRMRKKKDPITFEIVG